MTNIFDGEAGTLSSGPIRVDLIGGFVRVENRVIDMQPLPLRLLAYLVANSGRIVSCDELRAKVFRATQAPGSTGIARQISVIRTSLGSARNFLVTARGGYAIRVGLASAAMRQGATPSFVRAADNTLIAS